MPQADPPRTCAARDGQPIDETEDRREQSTDDPGRDVPVGHVGELHRTADQVERIEDHGDREEPQRKDDEHGMDGMSQELEPGLHAKPPLTAPRCPRVGAAEDEDARQPLDRTRRVRVFLSQTYLNSRYRGRAGEPLPR
jgi:hypothetical protein